jgi:hypothetical protein
MSYIKYPRTYHLPFSEGLQSDDKMVEDPDMFKGETVVVTEKLDGENTTWYSDYMHARSIDGPHHESRDWVKQFHAQHQHNIPKGWRLCGENLFAKHSIHYKHLKSFFYLFSIWDDRNTCLSWSDTITLADMMGIETAPVMYMGEWSENVIKDLYNDLSPSGDEMEGYVVRNINAFHYDEFSSNVAKYVRANHVQSEVTHWRQQEVVPNKII